MAPKSYLFFSKRGFNFNRSIQWNDFKGAGLLETGVNRNKTRNLKVGGLLETGGLLGQNLKFKITI